MANARQYKKKQKNRIPAAVWEPVAEQGRQAQARCSACGFLVEASRAVETGWNATEFVKIRYKFCPMCGSRMELDGKS